MTDAVAPWRLRVATAIVALLAIGLGATTWIGRPGSTRLAPASGTESDTTSVTPTTSGATVGSVTTSATQGDNEEVRSVVADALVAWGKFAASGNLEDVEGFFDPDGPQWASLSAEAGSVGTGFAAEIVERSLLVNADSSKFVGEITFSSNDDHETVTWMIDLRQTPGSRWLIWSVSDTAR